MQLRKEEVSPVSIDPKVANVAEILDLEPDEDADSFHVFFFQKNSAKHGENPLVPGNL